ncbi:MAG TPA: helix-turn-helix transcriptional regulator [Selenomonadales bacterium]|nr:helix-turn-helix transcriptional regulator [Selenomonadales bacterium]
MIDKKFGLALRKLRTAKCVSQEEFAARIDVHRTYISQLERGLKSPSLRVLSKIARELGISLARLMEHIEKEE